MTDYYFEQKIAAHYLFSHTKTFEKKTLTLHTHPHTWEFVLFKQGLNHVRYYIDTCLDLPWGNLIFIPPGFIHDYALKDSSSCECLTVHIEDKFIEQLNTGHTNLLSCFSNQSSFSLNLTANQINLFEEYVDTAIDYLNENRFGSDICARSCLSLLLLLINSAAETSHSPSKCKFSEIIPTTLAYIDEHYNDSLSVPFIARQLNISQSRLCHLFKEVMGVSLWNYVISRRIEIAQSMLKQGVSVTQTCYECGFSNYAHFIKSFTKIVGIPPKKFANETFLMPQE